MAFSYDAVGRSPAEACVNCRPFLHNNNTYTVVGLLTVIVRDDHSSEH